MIAGRVVWLACFLSIATFATSARSTTRAAAVPLRALPNLPPEYLTHQQGGIVFHYHPSSREHVRHVMESATELRNQLRAHMAQDVLVKLEIRVAHGAEDFARLLTDASPKEGAVVALPAHHTLLIADATLATATKADFERQFRRGLANMAVDEVSEGASMPRWFREGFALHFSGAQRIQRARALWLALARRRVFPLADLDLYLDERSADGSAAQAEAADFVAYLLRQGDGSFGRILAGLRGNVGLGNAILDVHREDLTGIEARWRTDLARRRGFLPVLLLVSLAALGIAYIRRRRRTGRAHELGDDTVRDSVANPDEDALQGEGLDDASGPHDPELDVADLDVADLDGANLDGANLDGRFLLDDFEVDTASLLYAASLEAALREEDDDDDDYISLLPPPEDFDVPTISLGGETHTVH